MAYRQRSKEMDDTYRSVYCRSVRGAKVPVEEYPIPDFAAAPSAVELLLHLHSRRQQYTNARDKRPTDLADRGFLGRHKRPSHLADREFLGVNVHLVLMNPWEHPGITAQDEQGKVRPTKRFVTNFNEFDDFITIPGRPTDGSWKYSSGWAIPHPVIPDEFIGVTWTYEFYKNDGTKTNWIMNMYETMDETHHIQHDMVLREIFENKSADYDPRRQYLHRNGVWNPPGPAALWFPWMKSSFERMPLCHGENTWIDTTNGASSSSFGGINPGRPSYLYLQHPRNAMEQLNNVLLGDPDTTITDFNQTGGGWSSTDNFIRTNSINGTQKKRRLQTGTPRRRSAVWDSFSKVFNKRPDGVTLVWSICHYCYKLVKGDSSGGTSNMLRHRRSCNHKHDNSGGMEHHHGHQVPGSSTAMNTGRCSSPTLNAAAVTQEQDCPQPQLAAGTTGNTAADLHQLPAGDDDTWIEYLNSLITSPLYSDDDTWFEEYLNSACSFEPNG